MSEETVLERRKSTPAQAVAPGARHQSVSDWMTSPVKVIPTDTPISDAYNLMQDYGIRRLPVAEDGRLVGIVTLGDLREARASSGGSLSIYDQEYVLANMTVAQAMTEQPFTVPAGASIQMAAGLMLANKIGGLPVLDPHGEIVGILTESDIFRMLVVQGDRFDTAQP